MRPSKPIHLLLWVFVAAAAVAATVWLRSPEGPKPSPPEQPGKENLIQVEHPQPFAKVQSPLAVIGKARGFWYFEASFPIKLLDVQGNVMASAVAQAEGDWMTTEFVPFRATLTFDTPLSTVGTLVLEKDNPSGLPEHADELQIPVVFERAVSQPQTR